MTSTYETTIRNLLNGTNPELISFFQAKGVLKSTMACSYCNVEMIWTKKSNALDKFVWKCQNKRCRKEFLQSYLNEFMWRDNVPGDSFGKVMDLIATIFHE